MGDRQVSKQGELSVLALLEAGSITGTAKAVLEMAYESRADITGRRRIRVAVANFARGAGIPDNSLTRTMDQAQIPYSFIREQGRFDSSVLPQIRDLAKTHAADIIWTNSVKSHFLVHRSGVQKRCKWIAFHHGYTSTDFKMKLYNQLDRVSLRHADRVLTVCQPFAQQMEARGVARRRIRVQHMPVRPFTGAAEESQRLRAEFGLSAHLPVILSVGRLSHEKGHKDLITAFSRLVKQFSNDLPRQQENPRLILVGDGPERNDLEQQAAQENLAGQITFAGHRDDARSFYGMAQLFALPSYTEGTPNVLLEAMAARVPVVATRVGGIPELAIDGVNSLLVPAANPEKLAEAMLRVLKSPQFRNELVEAAGQVVKEHTPPAYFAGMRAVFFETVGAPSCSC